MPAAQISPWLPKKPWASPGMTASRFASPRTICGDLPPSSSVTFLKSRAAWTAISRPTSGLPVKLSLSTPGWRTSAAPAVSPKPGTTLTTPPGKPTSSMSFAIHSVDRDASSAGLRTTALPAASAGPSFQDAMSAGAFQAEIAPTTPTGSRIVYAWRVIPKNGAGVTQRPSILSAQPAKCRMTSTTWGRSTILGSNAGRPMSSASSVASVSMSRSMASASR